MAFPRRPFRAAARRACFTILLATLTAQPAVADRVRITNLTDVNFGALANVEADHQRSQALCVFSNDNTGLYRVTAMGSAANGTFALSNGATFLPFQVEWSDRTDGSTGRQLLPNSPLVGQTSAARNQTCGVGPTTSATLTVGIRGTELSQAQQGNYSGSLTIIIGAE